MKVHVALTNNLKKESLTEIDLNNTICAVIDTIRASSTIVTLIACGASSIVVANDKKEAFKLKEVFPEYLLCGEDRGTTPKGFDYGNSPLEFSSMDVKGKKFIIRTTNGTDSIIKSSGFKDTFIMSILNLHYVLDVIIDAVRSISCDILLICSGKERKIAYDDVYTAGLAVKYLLTRPYSFKFTDSAKLVMGAALSESIINNALSKSSSAAALRNASSTGMEDISFLSSLNRYKVAPVLIKRNIKDIKADIDSSIGIKAFSGNYLYFIEKNR